jgi:hypothetical protein
MTHTSEVENRTIPSRKSMLTVLWNAHGLYVTTILHMGASFDAAWFIDQNLISLAEKFFPMGGISDKENW